MPNCGCGLTAKLQEKGGADLICASATSWWRMKGQGSLAPLMPYNDINEVIFQLVPEIVATVKNVPLLSLSGATNPLLPHKLHLQKLWDAGISGINPFMMRSTGKRSWTRWRTLAWGGAARSHVQKTAHEMNMFPLAYAFTPKEATILAEAGAAAISSHVGATQGGLMGAKTGLTLEQATQLSHQNSMPPARSIRRSSSLPTAAPSKVPGKSRTSSRTRMRRALSAVRRPSAFPSRRRCTPRRSSTSRFPSSKEEQLPWPKNRTSSAPGTRIRNSSK